MPVTSMKRPLGRAFVAAVLAAASACGDAGGPSSDQKPAASAALVPSAARPPSAQPAPDEKLTLVTSESAPLLVELEDDADSPHVARPGDLFHVVREVRRLRWESKLDGVPATREGMGVEVRLTNGGTSFFTFQSDLGGQVTVPAASVLCEAIGKQGKFDLAACLSSLRRARTPDGALLVYFACNVGPCPVGVHRDGKLAVVAVEGVVATRFYVGKKRSLLLAETRWTSDEGKQSGGHLVPVLIDGGRPVPGEPIPTDRVDARDPAKVTARVVQIRFTPTEVTVTGEEKVTGADGKVLSSKKLDEKRPFPSLD
jgi:hypothetical protein